MLDPQRGKGGFVGSPVESARPRLEQVGARAGVSRATVSRVVNGVDSVAPHLRERVQRAIAELGYQPNLAARSLVTRRTDTFALVASESDVRVFGDPFFSGIVRGVTIELGAAGLQVLLVMAQSRADLDRFDRYVRSGALDGVLLISEHSTLDPLPDAVRSAGVPLVIGGRPLQEHLRVPYVDHDNVHGARIAAERLLSAGRSRIGTLAGPQDMCAGLDRLEGFRHGLGPAFDRRRVEIGDFTQAGGEAAAARLLGRVPDVDGIFVASDLMALGALKVLRRAGRRVPDDIAVVGFDDIEMASTCEPPLTTVRQQTQLQGRTMARLLLARARPELVLPEAPGDPVVRGVEHVVLPVRLVVRESA